MTENNDGRSSAIWLSRTSNTQQTGGMPHERYRAFEPVTVPDRTWPDT